MASIPLLPDAQWTVLEPPGKGAVGKSMRKHAPWSRARTTG